MAIEPHGGIRKLLQELLDKLGSQEIVSNHEELSGLMGGAPNEHYHITQSEREKLSGYPRYGDLSHESLQGLLGGNSDGHYHLTKDEHEKLSGLPSAITQNHEGLNGLLGGNAAGHYHLTPSELGKLQAYPDYGSLNHEQLQGLLGGNSSGHYHLTQALLTKLENMPEGGNTGEPGQAATIQVGRVTTGAAGSSASVTNVGTSSAAIFDFVIPRGATGAQGPQGPAGSGSNTKYRLVRQVYECFMSPHYATGNDKGAGSLEKAQKLTIPSGVNEVYISGCGGGGGLTCSGFGNSRIVTGWTGAQCLNVKYEVSEGDEIAIYAGRGGANYDTQNKVEGSRGEDSIVWINGVEKVRLAGGNRGNSSGNAGNQGADTKVVGYALDSLHVLLQASYSNSIWYGYVSYLGGSLVPNDETDFVKALRDMLFGATSPHSLFGEYGRGATSLQTLSAEGGNSGLMMIEYIEAYS